MLEGVARSRRLQRAAWCSKQAAGVQTIMDPLPSTIGGAGGGIAPNIPMMLARLSADWSAEAFNPRADALAGVTPEALAAADPLLKCRLLLSCLIAANKQAAFAAATGGGGSATGTGADTGATGGGGALAAAMRRLGAMALSDEDAWVRVFGAAAGDFDGRLDADALVAKGDKKVAASVARLREVADGAANGRLFPPLENAYIAPAAAAAAGGAAGGAAAAADAAAAAAAAGAAGAAGQEPQQQQHFTPRPPGEAPARVRPRVARPVGAQPIARQGALLWWWCCLVFLAPARNAVQQRVGYPHNLSLTSPFPPLVPHRHP